MSLPGPPTSPLAHLGFELVAYFVGVRWFLARLRRNPNAVSGHPEGLWVMVGAILGAAVGSKVLHWLQFPAWVFTDFPDPVRLLGGKTLVGGLLGGSPGWRSARSWLTSVPRPGTSSPSHCCSA